jgi:hypothetical protein
MCPKEGCRISSPKPFNTHMAVPIVIDMNRAFMSYLLTAGTGQVTG